MKDLLLNSDTILRYGDIVCVLVKNNDKYIIVNYKKDCYEIEKTLGTTTKVTKYKNSKPKYYNEQINCKHNLINLNT